MLLLSLRSSLRSSLCPTSIAFRDALPRLQMTPTLESGDEGTRSCISEVRLSALREARGREMELGRWQIEYWLEGRTSKMKVVAGLSCSMELNVVQSTSGMGVGGIGGVSGGGDVGGGWIAFCDEGSESRKG